jgi:hypothetical protein
LPHPLAMKSAAVALAALLCVACSGTARVTRVYAPADAARVDQTELKARAVLRDGSRIPLPNGARVSPDRVILPRRGEAIPLYASDGIEMQGELATGRSVPGGGHIESTRSTTALIAGAVVLSAVWLPTMVVGFESRRADDRVLAVPLLGPWIDLGGRPACVPPGYAKMLPVDWCLEENASRVALVASGALQLVGGVLVALGLPTRAEITGGDRGVALVMVPGGVAAVGGF